MTGSATPCWDGCHGVRLSSTAGLDVGAASGEPLVEAVVERGSAGEPSGTELWRLALDVDGPSGPVRAEQALWRRGDGALLLHSNQGAALSVDPIERSIVVVGSDDSVRAQLVVTYGLPLLLHEVGALVVHGAACALGDRAVLVCGERGRGKSSLLVGLTDAGWRPISEDLCALDLRNGAPVVWPGPPWVRRVHGETGPAGSTVRFRAHDKTAWDIGPLQTTRAVDLGLVVFLDAPGGAIPRCEAVSRPEVVRRLAADSVWLDDPDRRGSALFEPVSRVSGAVPAVALQAPRRASWLDGLPDLLATTLG